MMGSSKGKSEKEELNDYYAENTVFVAVGKQVKESESVLWAAKKFAGKKKICILHVHQPAQLVSYFDGKFTTSKLKQRAIKAIQATDVQKAHKLVNHYVFLLSQTGMHADRMWIETDNIKEGIVSMIVQHGIKWLVMGAAADKYYTTGMTELKSQKAIFVHEQAPPSCHIWFTCRGNLIYTRQGIRDDPGICSESHDSNVPGRESPRRSLDDPNVYIPLALELLDSNIPGRESDHRTLDDPGGHIPPTSDLLDSNVHGTESGHRGVDDPSADNSQGPLPLDDSNVRADAAEHVNLSNPNELDVMAEEAEGYVVVDETDADTESLGSDVLDSDVSTGESETQSLYSNSTTEDAEDLVTESSSVNGLSLESDVESEESRHERLDYRVYERASPPRLTFRERGSVLRACSVDLDSFADSGMTLSSNEDFGILSGYVSAEEKGHEIKSKMHISSYHSSFNAVSCGGKMARKANLEAPRKTHNRLEQAILDAEHLKKLAFQESLKRWKAEGDASDAKTKAKTAESKCAMEVDQRKILEKTLRKQNIERRRLQDELENHRRELPTVQDQCCGLEKQIRESELTVKEFEKKIVSAVELLITFRNKRDQVQIEHGKAIEELESLKRLKEQRTAVLHGPKLSAFSFMEIGEATCSYDPSKKIGDGKYGSIYRGILRHTEVTMRMLPNGGSQSQWEFERELEIISRVRHPNIVMLIGICPEIRCIVYEYLEKGSLEDHLSCREKTSPLQWQTRVRIASELCSALIFLHTNNPPVYHGNLQPTKVLLDANFISKIGDVGILRFIPQNMIPTSKKFFHNTFQDHSSLYTDPKFMETGVLGPHSDVYSFGIILLRLLTGKNASGIVNDVKYALNNGELESVLDSSAGDWPYDQAKYLMQLALWCCEDNRSCRPDLASDVWSVLEALRESCDAQTHVSPKKETHQPPSYFICPIFKDLMTNPHIAADGYTYEKDAIKTWFDSGSKKSPMTNLNLPHTNLIPNNALQNAIQEWLQRP